MGGGGGFIYSLARARACSLVLGGSELKERPGVCHICARSKSDPREATAAQGVGTSLSTLEQLQTCLQIVCTCSSSLRFMSAPYAPHNREQARIRAQLLRNVVRVEQRYHGVERCARRDANHTRRRRGCASQRWHELRGEQHVSEVVDAHVQLIALLGPHLWCAIDASAQDEPAAQSQQQRQIWPCIRP